MKRGLNIGCGRVILPCERPDHHKIVPESLYTDTETEWVNADKTIAPGVNAQFDCMRYPWPLADNSFDVALAAHLIEHIPHAVIRNDSIESAGDGWWAWWSEMGRVLKPDGVVYILCPFGWSDSAIMDPTHTRLITWQTLGYLKKNPAAPFDYSQPYDWDMVYAEQNWMRGAVDEAQGVAGGDEKNTHAQLLIWMHTRINIVAEICAGLKVSK